MASPARAALLLGLRWAWLWRLASGLQGSKGCGKPPPDSAARGETRRFQGTFSGAKRTWHVHVPIPYHPDTPVPAIVGMHGWQNTARNYEVDSGLSIFSEIHNFIVAYPEGMDDHVRDGWPWGSWNVAGTSIGVGPDGPTCERWADPSASYCYESCQPCMRRPQCQWTTCTNDVTPSGVGKGNAEVTGFLPRLYDWLEEHFCIDKHRLYATGRSNGGMAAYQLGVSMAHRLAAIAPVCGSFMRGFLQVPDVPMPVLDIHGSQDKTVPANASMSSDGYFYTKVADIFAAWRRPNRCADEGRKHITLKHWPTRLDGYKGLYCVSEGRHCTAPMVRCAWDGPHASFADGADNGVPNAELIWGFLSQHSREPPKEAEQDELAADGRSASAQDERVELVAELPRPPPPEAGLGPGAALAAAEPQRTMAALQVGADGLAGNVPEARRAELALLAGGGCLALALGLVPHFFSSTRLVRRGPGFMEAMLGAAEAAEGEGARW